MASIAISGAVPSNATESLGTAKAAPAQVETPAKNPAVLQPDTVKLSPAAQAKMMHRAGQSPALIAATLGTDVAAVDAYLNIKVVAQAAATPTTAPTEQGAPSAETGVKTETAPAAQAAAPTVQAAAPTATTATPTAAAKS